jgi:hypothetical protein
LPIAFTHLLSGIIVVGAYFIIKKPQSLSLLVVGLAAFLLPDIDHLLYWEPYMSGLLLPLSFADLFAGFGPRPPSYLHMWVFPAAIALLAAVMRSKGNNFWQYVALLAVGWAVHLALDGVLLF